MINELYKAIKEECSNRGYLFPLAILSQAVLECGWNFDSLLAKKYYNFFGMKCGGNWQGKSVKLNTWEEYDGAIVNIADNFRAYNSVQDGIRGYFDFINCPRYSNLKTARTSAEYFTMLKADGWATDSNYISKLVSVHNRLLEMFKEKDSNPQYLIDFANAVIRGEYGNGVERKERIYKAVQDVVNEILK